MLQVNLFRKKMILDRKILWGIWSLIEWLWKCIAVGLRWCLSAGLEIDIWSVAIPIIFFTLQMICYEDEQKVFYNKRKRKLISNYFL